jgi:hypothetical protein
LRNVFPIVSLLALLGIFAESLTHPSPDRARSYHAQVRREAERIPLQIRQWMGEDSPIPAQARDLLKPNVLISRRYVAPDGDSAMLLIVQSADARDMGGHHPPVCYPNAGWSKLDEPRDSEIEVAGMAIPITEYTYGVAGIDGVRERRILDFFVLKPVGPVREQRHVRRQASDYRLRHYGAAQIQVIVDGPTSIAARERIFAEFVEPLIPLIRAIGAPGEPS